MLFNVISIGRWVVTSFLFSNVFKIWVCENAISFFEAQKHLRLVFIQLYDTGKTEVLVAELSELDVVLKALRAGDTRLVMLDLGVNFVGDNINKISFRLCHVRSSQKTRNVSHFKKMFVHMSIYNANCFQEY